MCQSRFQSLSATFRQVIGRIRGSSSVAWKVGECVTEIVKKHVTQPQFEDRQLHLGRRRKSGGVSRVRFTFGELAL